MEQKRLTGKMKIFTIVVLLVIVAIVTILSWTEKPASAQGGPGRYSLNKYFPLEEGITWNYLQTYADENKNYEVYCVGGTEIVNGEKADKLWEFDSGSFEEGEPDHCYECMAWTKEGLKVYKYVCSDGSYITYDPPMIQFPHSIRVGETFSYVTTQTDYNASGDPIGSTLSILELTLMAEENVEVLAGSFTNCLKFSIVDEEDGEQILWLSQGIGEVKSVCSEFERELISLTERGTTYHPTD